MNDLENFVNEADKKSAYIKFEDSAPVVMTFIVAELVDDQFAPGSKTIRYTVEVDGVNKSFNSKSAGLARQMKKVEPGTEIEISKSGSGFKTKWTVTPVKITNKK